MSLNMTILNKLAEQSQQELEIQQFLTGIFQFESSPKTGWFMEPYLDLLEKCCMEEDMPCG